MKMSRFQKVVAQRVNQLRQFPFWKEKKTNDDKILKIKEE